MAQVPRKRSKADVQHLKDLLLEGWSIKKDGIGLLSYGQDRYFSVGQAPGDTMLDNNPKDFSEALQELEKEGYDVRHQSCAGSGCCQYSATAYWLVMVEADETPRKTRKTKKETGRFLYSGTNRNCCGARCCLYWSAKCTGIGHGRNLVGWLDVRTTTRTGNRGNPPSGHE